MMGKILINGIEFYAHGGISVAERELGQRYRANVELGLDLDRAAVSDDLADTVSYAEVAQLVILTARAETFKLLESMTSRLATAILESFPVDSVRVQLQKLLPPIDGVVGYAAVEIVRRRAEDRI